MAPTEPLLQHIRRVMDSHADDASLLERFVQVRDELAFAALVARHGPMVLGVCRRVLGDLHTAADAFQATFLVLARQASRLRHHSSQAAWLHMHPRETVSWLREQIAPVPTVAAAWIAERITELDSDSFAVRASAMRELEKKGEAVETALRKALENRPSPEVQRRLRQLLKNRDRETLRVLRGLEVLEHLGTPEAKQLLQQIGSGMAGARRTQEAKACFLRLSKIGTPRSLPQHSVSSQSGPRS
jgi:DNA-directed RNA polymerase specialized sigma24 family protein